ncbi:MAG: GNAT family N-acetyltransferase [Acidobacteriaceae bacterium]|nr:GNAT family N-acetyltransferase [Acidobacteriaceae bacterium]
MAALSDVSLPEVIELQQIGLGELDPLLAEEINVWTQRFAWDFRGSAELLRRFVQVHALHGHALRWRREVIGYAYVVVEGRKGLIGDFYVSSAHASATNEALLLGAVVQGLMLTSGVRRIESQLMMLSGGMSQIPFHRFLTRHDRLFMEVTADAVPALKPRAGSTGAKFYTWEERFGEEIAHLVAAAYRGHVDSEINDQYRTIPGARHFLTNIIRFPGCGVFAPLSSAVAVDDRTGRVCGACLTSMVSENSGHVTQLCVLPAVRGVGLGYELLRRSLLNLRQAGCTTVSLTVTCSNVDAIRLYESMGFRSSAVFPALVWEGF